MSENSSLSPQPSPGPRVEIKFCLACGNDLWRLFECGGGFIFRCAYCHALPGPPFVGALCFGDELATLPGLTAVPKVVTRLSRELDQLQEFRGGTG